MIVQSQARNSNFRSFGSSQRPSNIITQSACLGSVYKQSFCTREAKTLCCLEGMDFDQADTLNGGRVFFLSVFTKYVIHPLGSSISGFAPILIVSGVRTEQLPSARYFTDFRRTNASVVFVGVAGRDLIVRTHFRQFTSLESGNVSSVCRHPTSQIPVGSTLLDVCFQ